MERNLAEKEKDPVHIHKGNDSCNIVLTICLSFVIAFSIFLFKIIGFPALSITTSAIIGIICIRYARLYIYDHKFVIVRKSIIPKFSDETIFKYENIAKVEYRKGWTNWTKLLLLTIMPKGSISFQNRVSKADELIVITNDGKTNHINRIGNKDNFTKTIEILRRRITSATNSA